MNCSAAELVFPNGVPQNRQLKRDAKRNGIPYQDEQGRFADFHALRYTWATFLQRNGIAQRFAMKLMRHSDIKLTSKVYTDETQLPIYDSIKDLPRLGDYTQIRAQILGSDGQNVAQADATDEGTDADKAIENTGDCRVVAQTGAEATVERAKGIEPSCAVWKTAVLPLNYARYRARGNHTARACLVNPPPLDSEREFAAPHRRARH